MDVYTALVLLAFWPAMSLFEWLTHRYLMHRKTFPEWVYRTMPGLKATLDAHAKFHHGDCFRENFRHDDSLPCNLFNLTLDLPALPLLIASGSLWMVSPVASITLAGMVVGHHAIWGLFHRQMHNPTRSWVERIPGYWTLHRYHEKHHEQPGKNYNIVCLGADWLLGTRA